MPKIKWAGNGIGTKISVYKMVLHTQAALCGKYPTASKNDVSVNLLVIRQEEKIASKQMQGCVFCLMSILTTAKSSTL
jgi:hypothetical protein